MSAQSMENASVQKQLEKGQVNYFHTNSSNWHTARYAKVELGINILFPVEPVVDEVKYESLVFLNNNILLQSRKL